MGQLDQAVAACQEAIRQKPNFPFAWCNLGNALAEQNKLDEAVGCYREALRLDPGFALAHNNLGNALSSQGLLDEAREATAKRSACSRSSRRRTATCFSVSIMTQE